MKRNIFLLIVIAMCSAFNVSEICAQTTHTPQNNLLFSMDILSRNRVNINNEETQKIFELTGTGELLLSSTTTALSLVRVNDTAFVATIGPTYTRESGSSLSVLGGIKHFSQNQEKRKFAEIFIGRAHLILDENNEYESNIEVEISNTWSYKANLFMHINTTASLGIAVEKYLGGGIAVEFLPEEKNHPLIYLNVLTKGKNNIRGDLQFSILFGIRTFL